MEAYKTCIKKDDKVKIIAGKDNGKIGKVLKVAAMVMIAKKFATATYEPVICSYPFNAKQLARMGATGLKASVLIELV